VFGSTAYVHIPKEKRKKLDQKSKKMIFVGYEGNSNNYRLCDVNTRKITVSRDVIFKEDETNVPEEEDYYRIYIEDKSFDSDETQKEKEHVIEEPENNSQERTKDII